MSDTESKTPRRSSRHPILGEVASGLLRAVLANDQGRPVTRGGYAREASVSHATVSRAARLLMDAGLIAEGEELPRSGQGRPESALIPAQTKHFIGVAIDDAPRQLGTFDEAGRLHSAASNVWTVAVHLDGSPVRYARTTDVVSNEPADLVQAIAGSVRGAKEPPLSDLAGIGVLVGGHVRSGTIRYSPNLGGHADFDLAGALREELALPNEVPVMVDNDANALARQAAWAGRDAAADFGLILVKDDGIGAALIRDGRLTDGSSGGVGEIGHLPATAEDGDFCRCGNRGCLETVATPHAVARRLGLVADSPSKLMDELDQEMRKRSAAARTELDSCAEHLGRAVSVMTNLTDPGSLMLLLPEALATHPGFRDRLITTARAHTLPSLRGQLEALRFAPLPDAETLASAATVQLLTGLVDRAPSLAQD